MPQAKNTTKSWDHSAALDTVQYRTIDGLKIRYATSEKASGDPRFCCWSLRGQESILAFLPTWDIYAALGPVVAVDLPGFGRSESRHGILTPEGVGNFIPHILNAFGFRQPHAVGPDIGTPALLYAAANNPGLFKSM